ncbi:MAG: YihY/virulence factor BrkB family protein [Deltaproteobacteria bacterium]|nr:YihY/virulence factor BrkB family protein [Deltaproteobacteria bacterium]
MISSVTQFLTTDIWRIRLNDLSRSRSSLIRLLRICILSVRGLVQDKLQLRASALTLYTVLSVVPVCAMLFGIAKGFGFEKILQKQLMERLEGQGEVAAKIIDYSNALLENTQGGMIAGIGIVILFWAIIKILGNIEKSFNDIWGIKKGRSVLRKITDYLSIMLIGPFLLILSSGLTVLMVGKAETLIQRIALLGPVAPVIFLMLKLVRYGTIPVLFSFVYIFMPNTKVRFKSGILAGLIAGVVYQIFQWGYIVFQVGVAKYNAIYGSFAALPLFLIWLQLSWVIVLFGAEVSFAHQNVDTFEFEPDALNVSYAFKRLLGLRIVHLLVKHFSDGDHSWDETKISHTLDIPIRLVRQILYELIESGIVSPIKVDENGSVAFQPGRNPDSMTIKYVIDVMEWHGSNNIPVAQSEELKRLAQSLKSFDDLIETSPDNVLLKDV